MDYWLRRGRLSNESNTTRASTGETDVVSDLRILLRNPVSTTLGLQKVVKNGSIMISICLWVLFIQVMKLPLTRYAFYATKCYKSVLCYLPNFVDIVILITLNVRTMILVFFMRKLEALANYQSLRVKSSKTDNENATEVSYRVSCLTALAAEARTVAETLVKLCALEMATCVLGEESRKKLDTVQLSNNAVKRRIEDLSADIKKQLVSRLISSFAFSLRLDESTDVSRLAALFVFVRYLFENKMEEDALSKYAVLKLLPFPTTDLRSWIFKVCGNKI
jgi:hypothetical protein